MHPAFAVPPRPPCLTAFHLSAQVTRRAVTWTRRSVAAVDAAWQAAAAPVPAGLTRVGKDLGFGMPAGRSVILTPNAPGRLALDEERSGAEAFGSNAVQLGDQDFHFVALPAVVEVGLPEALMLRCVEALCELGGWFQGLASTLGRLTRWMRSVRLMRPGFGFHHADGQPGIALISAAGRGRRANGTALWARLTTLCPEKVARNAAHGGCPERYARSSYFVGALYSSCIEMKNCLLIAHVSSLQLAAQSSAFRTRRYPRWRVRHSRMRAVHGRQRPPLPLPYPSLKVRPPTHCPEPLAGQKQGACMKSLTVRLLEGGLGPLGDQLRVLLLLLGESS